MADNIVIKIDLDKGDVSGATKSLENTMQKSGRISAINFSREFNSEISSSITSIGKSIAKATSLVGGLASAYLGFKSINAAQVQEDAVNSLNNALATAGDYSLEASKSLQEYASQLQTTTRFGDELLLGQIALAKSFNATNDQAKEIVKVATDLSAAFGISLETATRNVSKTLGGLTGELGEIIPELKNLTKEQLQSGAAIDFLSKRFSGAAQRDVKTYSGALDQLSNSFGDTLEAVGRIVTTNPSFIKAINLASKGFQYLTNVIDNAAKNFNLFGTATNIFFKFNDAIVNYALPPMELLYNLSGSLWKSFEFTVAKIIELTGKLGSGISFVLEKLGIGDKISKDLNQFAEASKIVSDESAKSFYESYQKILDFPITDSLSKKNDELKQFFNEQFSIAEENQGYINQVKDSLLESSRTSTEQIKGYFTELFNGLQSSSIQGKNTIEDLNKSIVSFASSAGQSLQKSLGQAAGRAFSEFGAALVKGENALDAFAKSLFKSIADQAVALGTSFILQGTAMLFSPNPLYKAQAPFLIKSGASLATFGGALGALSGGGGGGAASGGGTTGSTTGEPTSIDQFQNDLASPDNIERTQPSTNVSINVQGSLVQQEELGEFITRTLSESFGKQGITLTNARLA